MRISELIEELQKAQIEHGDLPVYHYDDWSEFSVEKVKYCPEIKEPGFHKREHVLLGEDISGFGERIIS